MPAECAFLCAGEDIVVGLEHILSTDVECNGVEHVAFAQSSRSSRPSDDECSIDNASDVGASNEAMMMIPASYGL